MVKNTKGGSKHKKYAKNKEASGKYDFKNLQKDEGQEYAFVSTTCGGSRFRVNCWDKITRLAHVRGKLRKRCWVANNELVLVSLRDFQDEKCDIIMKYDLDQVQILIQKGEISEQFSKDGQTFADEPTNNVNIVAAEPGVSLKDIIDSKVESGGFDNTEWCDEIDETFLTSAEFSGI